MILRMHMEIMGLGNATGKIFNWDLDALIYLTSNFPKPKIFEYIADLASSTAYFHYEKSTNPPQRLMLVTTILPPELLGTHL